MQHKKMMMALVLGALVTLGVAAVKAPPVKERNLKILPSDISDEKLDSIMHTYNKALGVNCNFCHVPYKGFPDSLDFASDAEPMKDNARKMMEMTININKTWFNFDDKIQPVFLNTVVCKTCHRGEPFPPEN